jgi:hypothetical protein
MTLNFNQLSELIAVMTELQDTKMPFKLSLMLAKNLNLLKKEEEFYIEQERQFAQKYLEFDSEKQEFVQTAQNVFKIKDGLEEECREAREALNNFATEVELRMIPLSMIEDMEFTPKQLAALEMIIEEE